MKTFGLVCNTMIVTSFFMKLVKKVKPRKRSESGFPTYAVVHPIYFQSKLHEGIVFGYAYDKDEAESISNGTPMRSVPISLDVKYGVLGYTSFIPLNEWCSRGFPDCIIEWMKQNYFNSDIINRIAEILNGKLKRK